MGHISKERYEQKKIDRLLNHLRIYADKGHPIDFEILVDDFKVVRRTNDPEMFSMYEDFVDADTQTIEFLFYTGNSNNNHKHIFYFGTLPGNDKESLDGIDMDTRIEEGVQKRLQQEKYTELEKTNKELQDEINELEKDVARLEKEKAELLAKQSPLNSLLGEVGSSLVESFIRRNPKIMSSIPGGQALAGLIEDHTEASDSQEPEPHVSFRSKPATTSTASSDNASNLTAEEQAAVTFVSQLKSQFTKDEFDKVLIILQAIAEDKGKIDQVIDHINSKNPSL